MCTYSRFEYHIITNMHFPTPKHITLLHLSAPALTTFQKIIYTWKMSIKARELLQENTYTHVLYNINSYNILIPLFLLTPYTITSILILGSERLIKHIEELRINFGPSPMFVKTFILSRFDGVITVSRKLYKETSEILKKRVKPKLFFLPAMSQIQLTDPTVSGEKCAHARVYQKKKGEFVITYIGNLHKTRGWETLLQALSMCSHTHIKLVVCWNGIGNIAAFQKEVQRYGLSQKVTIQHEVLLHEAFHATSVFILPCNTQSNVLEYPLTILESLYFGVPVICSQQPSFYEIISNGVNGLFFKTGSAEDLAKKILLLYTNKRLYLRLKINTVKTLQQLYNLQRSRAFSSWMESL